MPFEITEDPLARADGGVARKLSIFPKKVRRLLGRPRPSAD